MGFVEKRETSLNNVSVFSLKKTILFRCMRARSLMEDAIRGAKCLKGSISVFITIICSKNFDFGRILIFNKSSKMLKHKENFMLMFQQKEPCKTSTIINKNDSN